eukprot:CAMPEP_0176045870 /NCGR_PEP_ID=MMETSP0120_2-20121206/22773_1 /TAXON_ID=160619 /ORGANISM="Kryptoperidinium foliaceum, Strain CCMP 1326" /LENGTH=693 /DNA_ID=CAMNT_0017379279 /DNA_START=83 /DNA_END=2162 /DNA_ORIENTATION=-
MAGAVALATLAGRAFATTESPIGKVLTMLSDLQAKIVAEGEVVQKEYAEFAEWCEDRARNLEHEIKTGQAEVESLKAAIDEETSSIASLTTRVEELAGSIATDESELKAAKEVRAKEQKDFAAEEKELMETIEMIGRAVAVLEREMAKGVPAMVQVKNAGNLLQALSAMVDASMLGSSDAAKLTALVQEAHKTDDADSDPGAPAAAVYESKSGSIVDTLQDLQEKAESQLDEARKKETTSTHNFEMLQQSLQDAMKFAKKDMDEAKKGIAASQEKKSEAEGELETTSKDLAADIETKGTLHHDCMTKAADFEAETKSRGEELKALATAKQVITEAVSGAASFVQVARTSHSDMTVVRMVRGLAHKEGSAALAQLASRMAAVMRQRGGSADPFAKVKSLITDMISKLQAEAEADATKKAYCDKELKETGEKKADKAERIESLTTKIEQAAAKSAKLKEEIAALESSLAALSKSQAEMDKMRMEQKETFTAEKAELEKGLKGLQLALQVLREYYAKDSAHEAAEGSASGIIGLIEVCESDFSKNLAEITAEEEAAVAEYEEMTKANEIEKASHTQDVKYKVKEAKELDKTAAELKADRSNEQSELDAVLEYLATLQDECIAKPEPYEEKVRRREAEIAGLKEALQTLESETALVQRRSSRRALRGVRLQAAWRASGGQRMRSAWQVVALGRDMPL